jgi:hypothetical protein
MRLLSVVVAAALLLGACRGAEDHRADTTVGPTPVGLAGAVSVPPRPVRTSFAGIPFWTQAVGIAVATGLNVDPLPASVQRSTIGGASMVFEKETVTATKVVCPRLRTAYAVSDVNDAQRWISDALGRAGHRLIATPRLADIDTSITPIVQAVAADGAFAVSLSVSRTDPASAPLRLTVDFRQLCER